MNTLKAVFFDNDGVLMDTERVVFESSREAFAQLGVDYRLEDFHETVFLTNKGSTGFMKDRGILHLKEAFAVARDKIWNPRLQAGGHLIEGVTEVLSALRQKAYKIGLTTSAKREKFLMMSEDCDLYNFFDFHLFREDCTAVKPDPEIYLKALKIAGVKAHEAIVIEDAPRGIQAAVAAGIKVVAVENEMLVGIDTSMADFSIKNIKELPDLLESLS